MADGIGPALPPGFLTQHTYSAEDDGGDVGPHLPTVSESPNSATQYGPALPPTRAAASKQARVIGPALPPGFTAPAPLDEDESDLPADQKESGDASADSDDDFIGPSINMAAAKDAEFDAAKEFAERNRSLEAEKKRAEAERSVAQGGREEWMMTLPTVGLPQDIGVTARTFRNKAAVEQDDSWTLTPEQRRKKAAESSQSHTAKKREHSTSQLSKQDEEISKKLQKYNESNRKESLVEMHQKKLKKEKKAKGGEKAERVPFSRETDLQVNKFDEAQRKSVLKKAALLDTRFGHGSQKYE